MSTKTVQPVDHTQESMTGYTSMHNEEKQILVWGRSPSLQGLALMKSTFYRRRLTFERHKGVLGYFTQLPAAHALEGGHDPTGRHEQ
jgi:hypothetical protein